MVQQLLIVVGIKCRLCIQETNTQRVKSYLHPSGGRGEKNKPEHKMSKLLTMALTLDRTWMAASIFLPRKNQWKFKGLWGLILSWLLTNRLVVIIQKSGSTKLVSEL